MKLLHYGLHAPGNAGDTLLFQAVRDVFDRQWGKNKWVKRPVHGKIREEDIKSINESDIDAVVIGGGGLLLRDTNRNFNSGWQFNCPTSFYRKFKKPLIVFAIGYNRFRKHEDFDPVFRPNINAITETSVFFGMRNQGSINKTAEYLTKGKANLAYQPCPTTLLSKLYPEKGKKAIVKFEKRIAFNMAYDRRILRFPGNKEDKVMAELRKLFAWLQNRGYKIDIVAHCGNDAEFAAQMAGAARFSLVWLAGRPWRDIVNYYRQMPITIGMRGHSQLVPFGAGNAIISLITHDKLKYFLKDIGHPEFGVEITNPNISGTTQVKIKYIEDHFDRVRNQFADAQEKLWKITCENLANIKGLLA